MGVPTCQKRGKWGTSSLEKVGVNEVVACQEGRGKRGTSSVKKVGGEQGSLPVEKVGLAFKGRQ